MFFEEGRCPLCGNFGKEIDKGLFHCPMCEVIFDMFFVFSEKEPRMDWS